MTDINHNIDFILNLEAGFCLSFIGSWKGKRPDLPSYRTWPWKKNGNRPPCAYRLNVYGWWFILVCHYLCCLAGFTKPIVSKTLLQHFQSTTIVCGNVVILCCWSWKIPCLNRRLMGRYCLLPLTSTKGAHGWLHSSEYWWAFEQQGWDPSGRFGRGWCFLSNEPTHFAFIMSCMVDFETNINQSKLANPNYSLLSPNMPWTSSAERSRCPMLLARAPWYRFIIEESSLRLMMAFMFRLSQASKPDQGSAGLPVSEPQESHTSDPKCVMGESNNFWTSWTCCEFRVWTTMWPCVLKTTSWARAIPNCRCVCVSNHICWFIDWLLDRDSQYPSILLCASSQTCEINYVTAWMLKSILHEIFKSLLAQIWFLTWRFMRPLLTNS